MHNQRSASLRPIAQLVGLAFALCSGACVATPEDLGDAQDADLEGVTQSLDGPYLPDGNDGKACYLDGPTERKGKMDGGWCCYAITNGEACVYCSKANQCSIGGGSGPVVSLETGDGKAPGGSVKLPVKVAPTATRTSLLR